MAAPARRRSLRADLLAWALGALGAVWLVFVVVGFETGLREADELTDGQLASVAALLLSQREIAFAGAEAPMLAPHPGEALLQRTHDYQQPMSVVVWDAQGRVLAHTGAAPLPAFDTGEGFATLKLGSPARLWRSFARWQVPERSRRVMALMSIDDRDHLAWDIGGQVAEPGLWLLPVVALVLGLAIRRGLRPLDALSAEVHALDVQRATPLPPGQRPLELAEVVEAINTLVLRYHAALAREQQLASELAHELRTPLASLSLHARGLQGAMDGAERLQSLQRIEQEALRAGQLVNQLLALARASRAELAEAAQPLDLAELARRVVADCAQAAFQSQHELALEAPEAWPMTGHPVLLEMALRNLVDNALAHTPAGTLVEVQLDAGQHWLQVCDNGVDGQGMAAPPPGAPASRALGLGLGHRVVDKVAAVHGARFEAVPPPPGFRTCYRISFARPDGA